MRISDWSSDVCSSDLVGPFLFEAVEFLPVLGAVAVARAEVAPLPALELEELLVAPVEPPVVPDPVILAAARDARIRVEHPGRIVVDTGTPVQPLRDGGYRHGQEKQEGCCRGRGTAEGMDHDKASARSQHRIGNG